ncbi:MAG TPA: MBL fold metallo-hydrolase [Spirochaetota bacterium]|nr:MBL fold metallo-hydrolase [Spirochaetota bacterium]
MNKIKMKLSARLILAAIFLCSIAGISDAEESIGISLYYGENAQIEIVSPGGIHVFVDVHDPSAVSCPGGERDILCTSHHHPDHISAMREDFTGKQLDAKAGSIASGDVKVTSIMSAHNSADEFVAEGGSNYIFLIETAGMRIAHFGDIGQETLTREQLDKLGRIDIAVMQFDNAYSSMDVRNKKGFNLMKQLNPRMIIPSHISDDAVEILGKTYASCYSRKSPLKILKETLPEKTSVLFLGITAALNGKRVKAKEFK